MKDIIVEKAAAQFGRGIPVIEPLQAGLIHWSCKVTYGGHEPAVVLQCINQRIFPQPENIIRNYVMLYDYLENQPEGTKIPALAPTLQQKFFWIDEEDNFWRATRYAAHAYALPAARNAADAREAAHCFARFTQSLSGFDTGRLHVVIPGFHNLAFRYNQFEEAIAGAGIMRLLRSTHLISELRQRKKLVEFYHSLTGSSYPCRAMHHDGKISNVLFNAITHKAQCPIDLDTVMPGRFFSDVGDIIRSVACTEEEDCTAWENIAVQEDYYQAIIAAYTGAMGDSLTAAEKANIHYSGIMMTYMQAMRFVTDFLNNDVYYATRYAEQNLNRALNQFILLEQLEAYLHNVYGFTAY